MSKAQAQLVSRVPWPPAGSPNAPVLTTSNLPTYRPLPAKRPAVDRAADIDPNWKKPKMYGPATSSMPIVISDDEESGVEVVAPAARSTTLIRGHVPAPQNARHVNQAYYDDGFSDPVVSTPDDYEKYDDGDGLDYPDGEYDMAEGEDDDGYDQYSDPDDEEESAYLEAAQTQAGNHNGRPNGANPPASSVNDSFITSQSLFDHRGLPLSEAAAKAARDYWEAQEELDRCSSDDVDSQVVLELMVKVRRLRQRYTELVLGVPKLAPGTKTFEPPRVELRPVAPETTRSEPVLSPEQLVVVELAASGKNIFYTGSAGSGKSTVLHAIRKRLREMGKNVSVMAPTGKVAIAINGTTTWTYASWHPDSMKRPLADLKRKAAFGSTTKKRFRQTDTIIIDEISMVENLFFERLNAILKAARSFDDPAYPSCSPVAGEKAFGGVQVIVTGDFCQLPPVSPFKHCLCGKEMKLDGEEKKHMCKCGASYKESDKWAFRSKAWRECNFQHILLKTIHRQSDMTFIQLLQKCRVGIPFNDHDINILTKHQSVTANAVKLFCTRNEVSKLNDQEFARLTTPSRPYPSHDEFIWKKNLHPHLEGKGDRLRAKSGFGPGPLKALIDHRFEAHVDLKAGMLVLLLANLDLPAGLCNGSQGVIEGFEPYDPARLPRKQTRPDLEGTIVGAHAQYKESHIKLFAEQANACHKYSQAVPLGWPIVRFMNGITRTIYPECQVNELGDEEPYSLLCRTQIPLAPAWALSIHKSQGMTLDRVIVNLSKEFEEGQVYVALSRAKSLEGLKIDGGFSNARIGGNSEVQEFLTEKFGKAAVDPVRY